MDVSGAVGCRSHTQVLGSVYNHKGVPVGGIPCIGLLILLHTYARLEDLAFV